MLEHFRHACTKGNDVRMSTGTIFEPDAFPRLPISDLWNWKVVIQFCWKEAAHINELEMRSFLSSFLWRLRCKRNLCMIFRLAGSQVSMSVITKHCSLSIRLDRVARKIEALELASGSFGVVGYVKSKANPSDDPGRLIYDHSATHS